MKKCRKILIGLCLLLTALPFVLSACTPSYTDNVHTLQVLVEDGTLTEEALQNIAALRNGSLQTAKRNEQGALELETVEYTPTPVSKDLSKEQKSALLKDFKDFIEYRYEAAHIRVRVTESEIVGYFGVYDRQTVAEIRFSLSGLTLSAETSDLIISDYYLGTIGGDRLLICWTENE